MSARRIAILLAMSSLAALLQRQLPRAYAAWLIHQGDFGHLEAVGPSIYFLPAVRAYTSRRAHLSSEAITGWATRRLHPAIPEYEVSDIALHSSGVLVAALTMNGDERVRHEGGWQRLVALDPQPGFRIVADSGPLDFGGYSGLEVRMVDLDRDGIEEILFTKQTSGGGGENGRFYRLTPRGFDLIPSEGGQEGIWSWIGFEFMDLDAYGKPEIQGLSHKWANCPACGKDVEANLWIWKLECGRIRRWRIRGNECGPACDGLWAE